MTDGEIQTIRNVIAKLKGDAKQADYVRAALTGPCKLYLDTWVIGALECLLPERRDVKLAVKLSQ